MFELTLLEVAPLPNPLGAVFYIKYRYGDSREEVKRSIDKALEITYKIKSEGKNA